MAFSYLPLLLVSVYYSNMTKRHYVTVIYIVEPICSPSPQIPDKRLTICNYIWTPLSTAEIYYCDAIEQTSIARYLLCVDCLRDAGHRLSQRVHKLSLQDRAKYLLSICLPCPGQRDCRLTQFPGFIMSFCTHV
jgi:hypothetical protein